MRLVKWTSRERVDLPDFMAVQGYAVGEFRRFMRFLTGIDQGGRIVRGFQVQPAASPNATVVVKLDPGSGGPLGLFVGAETLTARVDHGQLGGGSDINGDTEGNAQQILDFSTTPPGTYYVQLQFLYADATTQNRVFWNQTTQQENTSSTSTRVSPGFNLQTSATPATAGSGWQDLAVVVWGGSTITSGNITDHRTFLFEGNPSVGFQATAWGDGTAGGMPDFDRTTARDAVGQNTPGAFALLLARQIQDIKGYSADGHFDVFSRPHQHPATSTSTTLSARAGVSLASLYEGATYTVGDGVSTFGDFNGATGLQDALTHVTQVGHPPSAHIMLKTGSDFTWTITSSVALPTNFRLVIEGTCFGPSGGSIVTGSLATNVAMLTGGKRVVFRNILFGGASGGGSRIIDTVGYVRAEECRFGCSSSNATEGVRAYGGATFLHCTFNTNVALGGANCIMDACTSAQVALLQNGTIRLYAGSTAGDPTTALGNFAHRTSIRSCSLWQVDTRGANDVSIVDSFVSMTSGACLIGGGADGITRQANLLVDNCAFSSGVGPSDYCIWIKDSGISTIGVTLRAVRLASPALYGPAAVRVENTANLTVNGMESYIGGSAIATGVACTVLSLANVNGGSIRGVTQDSACTGSGGSVTIIDLGGGSSTTPCSDLEISACSFVSNGVASTDTAYTQALFQPIKVSANNCARITVDKCRFEGVYNKTSSPGTLDAFAIDCTTGAISRLMINLCIFTDTRGAWRAAGDLFACSISNCDFECGDTRGLALYLSNATTSSNDLAITNNRFRYSSQPGAYLGNAGGIFSGNQSPNSGGIVIYKHAAGGTINGWNNAPAQFNGGGFTYSTY